MATGPRNRSAVNRGEVRRLVLECLADVAETNLIADLVNANLREDIGLGETALIQLVQRVDERYRDRVNVSRSNIIGCRTVNDLIDLIWNTIRSRRPKKKRAAKKSSIRPSRGARDSFRSYSSPKVSFDASSLPSRDIPQLLSRTYKKPTRKAKTRDHLDKCEYAVWYGTNRRPRDPENPAKGYTSVRDSKVHYGSCRVYIPKSHKIGSTGSPWWKRLSTWTDDRIKLRGINEMQATQYWKDISSQLAGLKNNERHAVIFVHGYNVSFREAAVRAAQIGFDISIKGPMAFFSWPSKGRPKGYPADAATIEASESKIEKFITDFANKSGAEAVHIIAHSMGNRGVLRAMDRIANRATQSTKIPFGQIILAAPDVDADTFKQLAGAFRKHARRVTLYASSKDIAVGASEWLHDFPRAGLLPPVCTVKGVDTINVTNVDLTLLGHGYVGNARDVLNDMYALINSGTAPGKRFGLRENKTDDGKKYWTIGA